MREGPFDNITTGSWAWPRFPQGAYINVKLDSKTPVFNSSPDVTVDPWRAEFHLYEMIKTLVLETLARPLEKQTQNYQLLHWLTSPLKFLRMQAVKKRKKVLYNIIMEKCLVSNPSKNMGRMQELIRRKVRHANKQRLRCL